MNDELVTILERFLCGRIPPSQFERLIFERSDDFEYFFRNDCEPCSSVHGYSSMFIDLLDTNYRDHHSVVEARGAIKKYLDRNGIRYECDEFLLMAIYERMSDALERGLHDNGASLPSSHVPYFRAFLFIVDLEMGGLSTYLANNLHDLHAVELALESLKTIGYIELAQTLAKALALFDGYTEFDEDTTWGDVLQRYDPTDELAKLNRRAYALLGRPPDPASEALW